MPKAGSSINRWAKSEVDLFKKGLSNREIADATGKSIASVYAKRDYIKKNGAPKKTYKKKVAPVTDESEGTETLKQAAKPVTIGKAVANIFSISINGAEILINTSQYSSAVISDNGGIFLKK